MCHNYEPYVCSSLDIWISLRGEAINYRPYASPSFEVAGHFKNCHFSHYYYYYYYYYYKVIRALNQCKAVLLVLLGLFAAFDTVDHDVLFSRLKEIFGLLGEWFLSYRDQPDQTFGFVIWCTTGFTSAVGPLVFTMYTRSLGIIAQRYRVKYHLYAAETYHWILTVSHIYLLPWRIWTLYC